MTTEQLLVNLDYTPPGCVKADGCENLHLRYDTRLDRDLFDVVYLLHELILTKVEESGNAQWDQMTRSIMEESEARVRRSLKLIACVFAFFPLFSLYSILTIFAMQILLATLHHLPRSPHGTSPLHTVEGSDIDEVSQVYHVFWQLELLPNWPDLALSRYGEEGGPANVELEVTETELDWFAFPFFHLPPLFFSLVTNVARTDLV